MSKIFLFGGLDKEQTLEVLDAMFEKKVREAVYPGITSLLAVLSLCVLSRM